MHVTIEKLKALKDQIKPIEYMLNEQALILFKRLAVKLMKEHPEIICFRCGMDMFTGLIQTKYEFATFYFGTMREIDTEYDLDEKTIEVLNHINNELGPIISLGIEINISIVRNKNGTPIIE